MGAFAAQPQAPSSCPAANFAEPVGGSLPETLVPGRAGTAQGGLGKGRVRVRVESKGRLLPRQVLGEVGRERQSWSLGKGRENGEGESLFWIVGG